MMFDVLLLSGAHSPRRLLIMALTICAFLWAIRRSRLVISSVSGQRFWRMINFDIVHDLFPAAIRVAAPGRLRPLPHRAERPFPFLEHGRGRAHKIVYRKCTRQRMPRRQSRYPWPGATDAINLWNKLNVEHRLGRMARLD
jgi:hypothetical protein